MSEITLSQMLLARERRAETQQQLIKEYKKPIISFTMNIAGPRKNSPLIERAFTEGLNILQANIPQNKIVFQTSESYDTGCEAYLCVDMPCAELKSICENIEDKNRLGRLFDMDVIDVTGNKLSRKTLRGCIVCGAPGRECAAGRLHSVEELENTTTEIICDYFLEQDKKLVASTAVESLIQEVYTTPKPGLVDSRNNGSHKDMCLSTFISSANALFPFFANCFTIGYESSNMSPKDVFSLLKPEGMRAEKTMYSVTHGANTHKGIIYSMGLICASIGRLWSVETPFASISTITSMCSQIVSQAVDDDFKAIDHSTAGGYYYLNHGIRGIRGEAQSGFLSVTDIGLPTYIEALNNGLTPNDAGVFTLITLVSRVKDTNLYHRGGPTGAQYAKEYASLLLEKYPYPPLSEIERMDAEFIKKNLSPGGCADLLAITYFLYNISNKKQPF